MLAQRRVTDYLVQLHSLVYVRTQKCISTMNTCIWPNFCFLFCQPRLGCLLSLYCVILILFHSAFLLQILFFISISFCTHLTTQLLSLTVLSSPSFPVIRFCLQLGSDILCLIETFCYNFSMPQSQFLQIFYRSALSMFLF